MTYRKTEFRFRASDVLCMNGQCLCERLTPVTMVTDNINRPQNALKIILKNQMKTQFKQTKTRHLKTYICRAPVKCTKSSRHFTTNTCHIHPFTYVRKVMSETDI